MRQGTLCKVWMSLSSQSIVVSFYADHAFRDLSTILRFLAPGIFLGVEFPPPPTISQSLWSPYLIFYKTVAYLPHARKVEPQNQPFLSNTCTNNGTAGLRNPFLGYGPVNQLQRRRMTSHSNSNLWESRDLSTARYSWRNNRTEISVRGRCDVYLTWHW
jgi:hypothetical protein